MYDCIWHNIIYLIPLKSTRKYPDTLGWCRKY